MKLILNSNIDYRLFALAEGGEVVAAEATLQICFHTPNNFVLNVF